MYETIKDYVAQSLRLNGFRVKKDFRCPLGWIDVAGFKGRISIGIEITDKPRNVEYKLKSYPFTYRVIVSEKDIYKKKDDLIIIGYKRFHTLSKIVGDIPDFDNWIKKVPSNTIFEDVKRKIIDNTMTRKIRDGVVYLYMAEELIEDYSGNVTEKICYLPLFRVLVDLGLASRDTKEIVNPKTFMVSLTHDGVKLAKYELIKCINEKKGEINKIISKIGDNIVYILILGLMERRGLSLKEMTVPKLDLPSYDVDEIYYLVLPVLFSIPLYEIVKLLKYQNHPLLALCRLISYTVLYHKAKEFFDELCKIGLAVRIPVYDHYTQFYGYEYKTSKEVVEYLSKQVFLEVDDSTILKFKDLIDLILLRPNESNDLKIAIEKKLVRVRYGNVEVINEKRFERFIKLRIAKIIAEFLSGISP